MYANPVLSTNNGHTLVTPSNPFWDGLGQLLPNIFLSICLSILLSIILTLLTSWLSAAIGMPIAPFFLIIV